MAKRRRRGKENQALLIGALVIGTLFLTTRRAAAAAPATGATRDLGVEISKAFNEASYEWGIPVGVLRTMADIESAFRPDIIAGQTKGAAGEIGIMQITPKWHPNVNPYDPIESIWYAAGWLRELYDRFGSWRLAVAAYNWGPTNLAQYGINAAPQVTKDYVARVVASTGI